MACSSVECLPFINRKFTDTNITKIPITEITCSTCQACCCQLEVFLISDTGVPDRHIQVDEWGGETMLRLDDGWCSALDRQTYLCTIYENRPWACRAFELGSYDCSLERKAFNIPNS